MGWYSRPNSLRFDGPLELHGEVERWTLRPLACWHARHPSTMTDRSALLTVVPPGNRTIGTIPGSSALDEAAGVLLRLRGPEAARGSRAIIEALTWLPSGSVRATTPRSSRRPRPRTMSIEVKCERRDVHLGDQEGSGPDAQGRRHHGCRHPRPGAHRGGRGRRRGHGAGARAGGHPRHRRRGPHERPRAHQRHHGCRDHPGHGQGAHRPLRGSPGPGGAGRRLHRRVGGAHPGRRGQPHRQARLQGALRVWRPRPGRGPAPHQRGRRHDAHQG